MNNRAETAGEKSKYVWAIVSTMASDVRKPVLFDTFNEGSPNEIEVSNEILKMKSGAAFDTSILPRTGWFVAKPPRRIPCMFIANGFFVVDEVVKAVWESVAGDCVTLHPFDLLASQGGGRVGRFYVAVFTESNRGVVGDHEIDGMDRWTGSPFCSFRRDVKDDAVKVTVPDAGVASVWIDPIVRNSVFFEDRVYKALKNHLRMARFQVVRCVVSD